MKYLDLTGLSTFWTKAKEWITGEIQKNAPDLSKCFNAAPVYNSETKKIEFYHDSTKVAELDSTPFIKDGMVNTVAIADGKAGGANAGKKVLLITFNTDSGKEDIEVSLDGIFDASNYYTKSQVDTELNKKLDASRWNNLLDADPIQQIQFTTTDEFVEVEVKTVNLDNGVTASKWSNVGLIKPVDNQNVGLMTPAQKATLDAIPATYVKSADLVAITPTEINALFS